MVLHHLQLLWQCHTFYSVCNFHPHLIEKLHLLKSSLSGGKATSVEPHGACGQNEDSWHLWPLKCLYITQDEFSGKVFHKEEMYVWLVRIGHRCGVLEDFLMVQVSLISLMVSIPLCWLAEAYHSQIGFGCCWLLKVSRSGKVEHHRRTWGLIMLVDLIIITVSLPLCVGWLRPTRSCFNSFSWCPKLSSCVASCNSDLSINHESVSANTNLHSSWLD